MAVNNPRHSRFFWRSSAMFCILDFERQFKEVNAAWETTLGLSTGQLLAKRFLDFVHPDDQGSTAYYFERLEAGLPSVSFSTRFRHSDGSYRNVLWEINGAASVEYAYYAVGMDITTREQPMVADEMLNVLQEGVVLQYANGTIGACNPSAERILGLKAEQMMGWTLIDPDWSAVHEDNTPFPTETHPAICTLRTGQAYADVVMGIIKSDSSTIWIRINSYPLWRDDVTTPYAVVISFSDITHYKEKEHALRKNTQDKPGAVTLSDSNYDLWDWDLDTNETHYSARWKKMLGFDENELSNHIDTWLKRIHPADYKRVTADIQNHLEGLTQACENTHRVQHKDGSYRWLMSRSVMVRDLSGKPHRMVGTHIDVTEPRRVEEELQETDKKYRQVLEIETDAVFLIDANSTDILDANKAATHIYGYSRSQLLKTKYTELSAQPDKMMLIIKKGVKTTAQHYHKKQDGTVFPVEVTLSPFTHKSIAVFMVASRDISEKQRIENALWENEAKYRQLFEAASNPTIVYDANTQYFFDVNRATVDLYGYTKEEFQHMITEDVSAEPSKKRAAFNSGNKKVSFIPLRWHKKKDGTVFPVEISTGNTYLFQGRSLICATIRDITERKAAEEALRKERDFINTLVQASPTFFFVIDTHGKTRMMNNAMLNALEYKFDEVLNEIFLTKFIAEAEQDIVSQEFDSLIKTMQPSLMENHIVSKTGKQLLVEWHSRAVVKAEGSLDFIFGVGIDVTERKKAQGHLRLFKSIIESSEEAIAISSSDGQLVYINPAHEKFFRRDFKQAKEVGLQDYYPTDSLEVLQRDVLPALTQGKSWECELEMLDSQGSVLFVWQRFDAVRDTQGKILFTFSLTHDISERKRMWETLRKQWEEHQMIFNTIPAMIWYRDADNRLVKSNKLANDLLGHDDSTKSFHDCEIVLKTGKPQTSIMQTYQSPQGEIRWIHIDRFPYQDSQTKQRNAVVFGIDITAYKQAQASLAASEERMYLVVENMPMMLYALDEAGNFLIWNRTCEEVTGYCTGEILNNPRALKLLYPELEDRNQVLTRWYNTTDEARWETKLTCKDGKIKTIAWSSVAKKFPIPGWYSWHLGRDVTVYQPADPVVKENGNILANIFKELKLGVSLIDDRGRFIQMNRAFAEMYGYRPDELIGQPFTLILPTETHGDAVREYYSLLMTHEDPSYMKRRGEVHRTGQKFEVQMMASRVVLEDRRRLMFTVVSKIKS